MNEDEARHQEFLERNRESNSAHGAKALIARYLEARYIEVFMPESTEAKTHAEWKAHVDKGDMHCRHRGLGQFAAWLRLEVKWVRRYQFTSAKDYPQPTFYVCRKGSFDDADPRPTAYLQVSKNYTHCGIQMVSDSDSWWVEETGDSDRDGYTQLTYVCPLDKMHFFDLRAPEMPKVLSHVLCRCRLLVTGGQPVLPPGVKVASRSPQSF